ncbi:MAG: DUF885 family protein, partial [Candidatus Gallimonas sp.]
RYAAFALCVVLAMPLAACGKSAEARREAFWYEGEESENAKFTALTDRIFHDAYKDGIVDLHFTLKDPESYGFVRPEADLFAQSAIDGEYMREVLAELEEIEYGNLSRKNQITYRIIREDFTDGITWEALAPLQSGFDYASGIQSSLPTIATEYDFFVERDIVDYLAILNQVPDYFESLCEYESERVESGYGLSDSLLGEIIAQCESVASEGENSVFLSSFDARVDALGFLSAEKKAAYKTENREAVLGGVLPAYERAATGLVAFYGKGGNNGGLCGYEGGVEYYEALMKQKSGFGGTVKELENLLKKYLSSLTSSFLNVLFSTPEEAIAIWESGDTGELSTPEEILSYFSSHMEGYFPALSGTSYSINYLSEAVAATMPQTLAYYRIPQLDNYLHGSITVNGYAQSDGLMNTLAHEGYPGHMYQNVRFYSTNPDPVRTVFSFDGYTEGWAVYAANLAEKIYRYPQYDEQISALNALNVSYSYAAYALADIYVNYEGWSAAQIADSMGFDEETAQLIRQQLIMMPGVYLSYGAGNMMMESLLSRATKLAGRSFDPVEYHTLVLDVGPCNFSLLETLVDEYYR